LSPPRAHGSASLTLTQTANVSLATPGSLVCFKLTIKNEGSDPASHVVLTDPMPTGCAFISANPGAMLSQGLCSWNLGTLTPGASAELFLYLKISGGLWLAAITNTAQVTCTELPAPVNSSNVRIGISASLLP